MVKGAPTTSLVIFLSLKDLCIKALRAPKDILDRSKRTRATHMVEGKRSQKEIAV